jgi:hypothetical protein
MSHPGVVNVPGYRSDSSVSQARRKRSLRL